MSISGSQDNDRSLRSYLKSLHSNETRKLYSFKLRKFFQHRNTNPRDFLMLAKRNPKKAQNEIIRYLRFLRDDKKLSGSSIEGSRNAIAGLVGSLGLKEIDFRLVSRRVGIIRNKKAADRIPSIEEIQRLLGHCDFRSRALILLLCSSGIRIGAVQTLKWRDVSEIVVDGQKFAKVIAYAGTVDQYASYITPEAFRALIEYKNEREAVHHEHVNVGSFVISKFPTRVTEVAKLSPNAPSIKYLERYFSNLWKKAGLRKGNESGNDHVVRHEFKVFQGLRKFFKTWCEASGMRANVVEILLGNKSGLRANNQTMPDVELAKSYAAAIPYLSIDRKYRANRF